MTQADENKATVQRLIQRYNAGDLGGVAELHHDDFVDHSPAPGQPPGKIGYIWKAEQALAGTSDLHYRIDHQCADGEHVADRYLVSGTHTGVWMGLPATGRHFEFMVMDLLRLRDGLISENWYCADLPGLLAQLGNPPAS